ncbi:MAG: hypothetical protein NXH82_00445 [Rhodobacteraceae bacterium]|nr:hypothetical protein [Paracoccaceae bacterium]
MAGRTAQKAAAAQPHHPARAGWPARGTGAERRLPGWQLPLAAACTVVLAGCDITPDKAELANLAPWNAVPKSSPRQLLSMFETVCIDGPAGRTATRAMLRDLGYVPTGPARTGRGQLFLVDDRRPAVALTEDMCMVRAAARTGQTELFRDWMAHRFPAARQMPRDRAPRRTEDAWLVALPDPAIIATQRTALGSRFYGYGLIAFRPDRSRYQTKE